MKKIKRPVFYLIIILLPIIFFIYLIFIFDTEANKIKYKNSFNNKIFQIFISLPDKFKSSLLILTGKKSFNNLFNDYNVKFLPDTQNLKLDFKKYKVHFDKNIGNTFFIEIFENNLFVATKSGEFYIQEISTFFLNNKSDIDNKILTRNFNESKKDILINDILVIEDTIYVLSVKKNEKCSNLNIHYSRIDKILDFKILKIFDECVGHGLVGGGMQKYILNGQNGLLISTSDPRNDKLTSKAQNDKSILGKVLFLDFENKDTVIFSKGHRNPQGLLVYRDIILSTEHGPRGGDELNKIIYGKNYGWPISSYGKPYNNEKNISFYQSHSENGFQEPLFVFLTSVGISELIYLPNEFHQEWTNNFLISSLNGRSIYRTKFSQNFDKVIFYEKIFIGERIRDLKYYKNKNLIILALEDSGSIGILNLLKK